MSRLRLSDYEWESFFIGGKEGLFDIQSTKSGIDKNKLNASEGSIPYITRSDASNGINLFVTDIQNPKFKKDQGNVITIGLDTQTVFYQPNSFYTGQNIQVLKNEFLNKEVAQFIIPLLKIQMEKFNWGGNGATLGRLNRTRIMLPIDEFNKPNWQFMEDYIKQEQKTQAQKIIGYYEEKMMKTAFDLVGLENVEWKTFSFTEIFREIKRGKRLKKADHIDGSIPYVSSTALNNGVDSFVGNIENVRSYKNNLSLANSGSVGSCFYHAYEYVASDHVTGLSLENPDKNIYLFMSTVINRISEKYSFSREINDQRITREKIMLPADSNGNPHWDYMGKFIQKIELEKLEKALPYIYIYIYEIAVSRGLALGKLDKIEWKEFWIEDILRVSSGVRLTKENQSSGKRPFVGATEYNNGITSFVDNSNASLDSNVLGVNYNGSVVENFYHSYECIFSDDVKRLSWLDDSVQNQYTYLFLKQCILQQKIKYAYGYKFNAHRMRRQKIVLPVDEKGQPNYQYMKEFMQIQEIKEQYKVLDFHYGKLYEN